MGEFSDNVYAAVKRIPRGFVSTYGDIAREVGRPRAARFVGYALHDNPDPGEVTPCHRVVFKDGRICDGFAFGGPDAQRKLLLEEGVVFRDEMHVDMMRCHFMFLPEAEGLPAGIDWEAEMRET
ncbi:MAG: MGMT family protein [Coriobacteriales bacterium]|jgi:methylated-DNA-protein-cysteine methyltransferase-like protein